MMKKILLLHGAIGSSEQLNGLKDSLTKNYEVHIFNFSGHGGRAYGNNGFSIASFANEVLLYLDEQRIDSINIFGYSMGGYVGMYLAKHRPQRVEKLITLATKFYWDDAVAAKETAMLDCDKISQKIPAFAETLKNRHAPNDWIEVLSKTKTMLLQMGSNNPLKIEDYARIDTPVTILIGDRDKMVTLEETVSVYKALPNAQMGMLTNCHHPIEQSNMEQLVFMINSFVK
jgi:pimeloyl-ACP methyl ester carboxylesterase